MFGGGDAANLGRRKLNIEKVCDGMPSRSRKSD